MPKSKRATRKQMKASNVDIGTRCSWYKNHKDTGTIIANKSKQGDEVVVVEWDEDFSVSTENVNDLKLIAAGKVVKTISSDKF